MKMFWPVLLIVVIFAIDGCSFRPSDTTQKDLSNEKQTTITTS